MPRRNKRSGTCHVHRTLAGGAKTSPVLSCDPKFILGIWHKVCHRAVCFFDGHCRLWREKRKEFNPQTGQWFLFTVSSPSSLLKLTLTFLTHPLLSRALGGTLLTVSTQDPPLRGLAQQPELWAGACGPDSHPGATLTQAVSTDSSFLSGSQFLHP